MEILNPLNFYGGKTHAYKVHCMRMRQANNPCVTFQAFCARLKKGWDVQKAIYTPANVKKIPNRINMVPRKSRWENLKEFLVNLFKGGNINEKNERK